MKRVQELQLFEASADLCSFVFYIVCKLPITYWNESLAYRTYLQIILWSKFSEGLDFIFATRSAMDTAQYAVDKANMNNVMPNVNMLDLDRNPRFLWRLWVLENNW